MSRLLQGVVVAATIAGAWFASANVRAYTFVNVADLTNPAPSGAFQYYYAPTISGSTATFSGKFGESFADGLFTGAGGSLTVIAKQGDAPPAGGINTIGNYASSGAGVAFWASFGSGGEGVFRSENGVLTTIALKGGAAPVGAYEEFGSPAVSGSAVAFTGHYDDLEKTAVVRGSGGPQTIIAKSGDAAPVGSFRGLYDVSISGNSVAFVGGYDTDGEGVFRGSGGGLTTIAKTGDTAPTGVFEAFYGSAISGDAVAFAGSYQGGEGIFIGNGGPLTTIVKTGDPAPIGVFTDGSRPAFSHGVAAFLGYYDNDDAHGIFLGSGGPLAAVVKTSDPLFGSTVVDLGLDVFGFDAGGSGNLAFSYALANGQEGIAVALALTGDFNNDGIVDGSDLPRWKSGFGTAVHAQFAQGDATGDRRVDGADFLVWQRNASGATLALNATPVCEPASLGLLLLASWPMRLRARRNVRRFAAS
ncbi:MAG: hypothetical protein KF688_19685 [Pirellulales bacterium]|nr:hypothetical protein [Pirellulales bacterium]